MDGEIMLNIIEQITFIYLNCENWHKSKLSEQEANLYHERLLVNGNIMTYVKDGALRGYIEFWRISAEQLGRIIIGDPILTDIEDITNGQIAYIANMWIDPEYRNGEAFEMLGSMFLIKNKDASVFVACRNLRHNKPVQVYKREELIRLYTKGI